MARLVIGNWSFEPGLGSLSPEARRHIGCQGQRMLWSARAGDVAVLPMAPRPEFVAYVATMLGLDRDALEVVVPPAAGLADVLVRDRFEDPAFLARLRRLVAEHGIDEVVPFAFDDTVNRLARRLDLRKGTPGFGFLEQGGSELLNSKVVFRALAAGIGVPVPDGIVTDVPDEVVEFAWSRIAAGASAMVKQDVHVAGLGNEILSRPTDDEPRGALYAKTVADRAELAEHVASRWSWYTGGLRRRVVVEHYVPDSVPVWAEVSVTDDAVRVVGTGEMRMKPVINGVVIPAPPTTTEDPDFLAGATRLGEAMRAMGYRGLTNIDAMVTPGGAVLFNEINARLGGSSHLYAIGERIIGGDYLDDRRLIERRDCAFGAFPEAVTRLADRGLAYDPRTRSGIVVTIYGTDGAGRGGECCIVGEDLDSAEALDRALVEAFPG
jgi:Pre ATP-grasp domain/PGM1 C-terminal domain